MKMDNKGMTIVEVMAGFMLLVVITVSFVKTVRLASELTTASVDSKNNSSEFNYKYYSGNNYKTTYNKQSKDAFRDEASGILKDSGAVVEIKISEWHLADDAENGIFKEYQKDSTGKFVENLATAGTPQLIKDMVLQKIENIYDSDMARIGVYRYVSKKSNAGP